MKKLIFGSSTAFIIGLAVILSNSAVGAIGYESVDSDRISQTQAASYFLEFIQDKGVEAAGKTQNFTIKGCPDDADSDNPEKYCFKINAINIISAEAFETLLDAMVNRDDVSIYALEDDDDISANDVKYKISVKGMFNKSQANFYFGDFVESFGHEAKINTQKIHVNKCETGPIVFCTDLKAFNVTDIDGIKSLKSSAKLDSTWKIKRIGRVPE